MAEGSVETKVLTRLYSDVLHYRPTKGDAANAYWHLREWCERNDYNIGELLNSLLPVIAYYALNFTVPIEETDKHGKKQVAITLSAGTIPIKRTSGPTGRRPTHKMYETRLKK